MKREEGKRQLLLALWCLLTAAVMIGLCSRSSPIFPMNDWDDTNCFFTVGKAMFNGRVTYRDIYEQKGVLLYFLYGLAWLISHRSFLGGYVLETLCFAAFLRTAAETARKLGVLRGFCLLIPCLGAVLCSSYSFFLGGCAEEIALPFLYPALHVFLTTGEDRGWLPRPQQIVLLGAMAGCVLWIKYTLLGLYVGYVLFIAILLSARRDFAALGNAAGLFLLGVLLATLPWLLYFGANGAVGDWFGVYFYDNMSCYSGVDPELGLLRFLRDSIGHAILWNGRTSLLIALGALVFLLGRRPLPVKAGLLLLYLCATLLPFIGGTAFDYYGYAYAAMAVPGILAVSRLLERGIEALSRRAALPRIAALLLCLCLLAGGGVFARRHSVNSFFSAYRPEDLWFSRFAADIAESEDQSLLSYGALDHGLYTVTGYVPQTRFFCHLNLNKPELEEEQDRYIREQETEFVLLAKELKPLVLEYYEVVDSAESFDEFESFPMSYYLLRRK